MVNTSWRTGDFPRKTSLPNGMKVGYTAVSSTAWRYNFENFTLAARIMLLVSLTTVALYECECSSFDAISADDADTLVCCESQTNSFLTKFFNLELIAWTIFFLLASVHSVFSCTLKQKFPPKFYTSFKIAFLLRRSLWEKFCGDFKDGAFRGVGIWHMHLLQRCLVHTGCCDAIWYIHHVATLSGTYTILQHSLAHTPCCKVLGTYTMLQRYLAHTPCCNAVWHIHHVATLFGTYTMLQRSLAHTPCCNALWHTHHFATLFGTYTMLQRCLAHTPCCNAVWHIHHVATLFGTYTMLQRSLAHTPFCNAFPAISEDSLHECPNKKLSVTSSAVCCLSQPRSLQ